MGSGLRGYGEEGVGLSSVEVFGDSSKRCCGCSKDLSYMERREEGKRGDSDFLGG